MQLRGVLISFLKLSAERFKFQLEAYPGLMHGEFNRTTRKWSGLHGMVSIISYS